MATPLDAKLPAKVLSLIARHGVVATVSRKPTVNEVTGAPTVDPSPATVQVSPPTQRGEHMKGLTGAADEGDVATEATLTCYVAGRAATTASWSPVPGDKLTVGSLAATVVAADPIRSGDEIAAWRLTLER